MTLQKILGPRSTKEEKKIKFALIEDDSPKLNLHIVYGRWVSEYQKYIFNGIYDSKKVIVVGFHFTIDLSHLHAYVHSKPTLHQISNTKNDIKKSRMYTTKGFWNRLHDLHNNGWLRITLMIRSWIPLETLASFHLVERFLWMVLAIKLKTI